MKKIERVPVVTILGHVDHGKTSILDQIRKADVQGGEAGGITQKISAFTIDWKNSSDISKITFVDTPGHEAFDLMRQRGGDIADVVLLVVAADDGLKPQTKESVEIIKNGSAKPIVVFNKVDLPDIDIEKIKRDLSTEGIQVEGYGGDVPYVEVSAVKEIGIDKLLDTIALLVDVEGLIDRPKLSEDALASGIVLETIKEQSRGHVSTVVISSGEVKAGDWLCYEHNGSIETEKIKAFMTENNEPVTDVSAGYGVKILGVSNPINLGADFIALPKKDLRLANSILTDRIKQIEEVPEEVVESDDESGDETPDWFNEMFADGAEQGTGDDEEEGGKLSIVVKSSSEGSLEALVTSLEKLDMDGYVVDIVSKGIGDVTVSDVELAEISKSLVVAFEVGVDASAKKIAEKKRIFIRSYNIIYKLIEEVEDALTLMATPSETEEDLGNAEIREIFVLSNGKSVLGGRVMDGKIKRGAKAYVVRDDDIVCEGKIVSLKHGKNDVKEATKGGDFGLMLEPTPKEVEVGDGIFCVEVKKT